MTKQHAEGAKRCILLHVICQFHNHAQLLKEKNSGRPQHNQTWYTDGWLQQKLTKFGFHTHTAVL